MKLDPIDSKILAHLYHHYRESITDIAKACKISKDQAAYRLNKLETSSIIKKYLTLFDYDTLGYKEFTIVWLRCKDRESVRKDLEQMHNVLTYGDMLGVYDLFINFIHSNKNEFETTFNKFLSRHKDNVIDYNTFIVTFFEFFDLKRFGVNKDYKVYDVIKNKPTLPISDTDWKILKLLEHNGRIRVVDIAKKTNLSGPAIVKKLRSLKERGIIQGVRLLLNEPLLGYAWAEIHLQLQNIDQKTKEKLLTFCKHHPHINLINFGISKYNCIIQVLYTKDEELRDTSREILKKFKDDIINYNLILAENEGLVRTLPFERIANKNELQNN